MSIIRFSYFAYFPTLVDVERENPSREMSGHTSRRNIWIEEHLGRDMSGREMSGRETSGYTSR